MAPLEIIYRDQWLIAVTKPAGILVHSGSLDEPAANIAQKRLRNQIGKRVNLLHRLDRPTSGVLLCSLDKLIDTHLRALFDHQEIKKSYIAIVAGETLPNWQCQLSLQKDSDSSPKQATTDFTTLNTVYIGGQGLSVVRAAPKTGRFHQIRKHLAHNGTPILGDYLYGDSETMAEFQNLVGVKRMMLHAQSLAFTHPVNSEDILITSPLPKEFDLI